MRLLIELDPVDPRVGLATDEVLLEAARTDGRETLRLWVNDRAAIVGRSQSIVDEVDARFAERQRIPILRRISGGGTVYHYPKNLNVSVALRDGRRFGSVPDAFRFFGRTISKALAIDCSTISFDQNDLLIGGAKVGGAAQARRGAALLYHTTLLIGPIDIRLDRLLLALRGGYHPRHVPSRPRATISLTEAIGHDVPIERIVEAIVPALSEALDVEVLPSRLVEDETRRVEELVFDKYGVPEWNESL